MTDQHNAVAEGCMITLNFALRLDDGAELDSTFAKAPATFEFGDGNLLPGFEEVLVGLKPGDRKQFSIPPEKAFGQPNPDNVQRFKPDQFDQSTELYPGLVMSFEDASSRGEVAGVVSEVTDEQVLVDFNHPLAGRVLEFEVEIIDVVKAGS